jgi:hypothetical protein
MSISARERDLEDAMRRQSAHLQVIARRTEPLSPTRKRKLAPPLLSLSPPSSPLHAHPSLPSAASIPSESIELPSPTPAVAPLLNGSGHIPSPPAVTVVTSSPETIQQMPVPHVMLATVPPHPSRPSPCEQPSVHTPILVMIGSERIHVLPLSPSPVRTSFDLILPPPAAFHHPSPSMTYSSFPTFDTAHCTWQAIFKMILQPTLLWDCWSPKALGAYPDVKSLWAVWQEGAFIEGVGRAPPLQLVEAEWGRHEDKRTGKGRLPAWRPRKDEKVSTTIYILSSFYLLTLS